MKMWIKVFCLFHVIVIIKGFPSKDTKESSEKSNLRTNETLVPTTSSLKDSTEVQENINETKSNVNVTATNEVFSNVEVTTKNETGEEGNAESPAVISESKEIPKTEVTEYYAETKNETVREPSILRNFTTTTFEGDGRTTLTTTRGLILDRGNLASATISDSDREDVQTKNGSETESQPSKYTYEAISSSEKKILSKGIPKGILCGAAPTVLKAGEEMSLFVPSVGGKCSWSFEADAGVESLKLFCNYISFLGPPEGEGAACLNEELTVRDVENPGISYCGFHKSFQFESTSGRLSIDLSGFTYKQEQHFHLNECVVKAL